MKEIRYEPIEGKFDSLQTGTFQTETFRIETDENGQFLSLKNPADRHQMNWVKGSHRWGTVKCNAALSVTVTRRLTGHGTLTEEYHFRNRTGFDICTMGTRLGIYTPFPDYYSDAAECMVHCCNTHLWCQGTSSYVMALRMGGEAPHLGLVLRQGSLQGYSVERASSFDGREEELSNHRGDFILHPENLWLHPGESYTLGWELFWFQDKEDFLSYLKKQPGFVTVESENFVVFLGEELSFRAASGEALEENELAVKRNGQTVPFLLETQTEDEGGTIQKIQTAAVRENPKAAGEYSYEILWKGKTSMANFLVLPKLEELVYKRCHFIAEHQQCRQKNSYLNGAYLVYDNEEKSLYYSHLNDHNGGRERVGMGVLLAFYLQYHKDAELENSLDQYTEYVMRELFDEETGEVFNDAPRCRDYIRLYNYPGMGRLFLELYRLKKDEVFLDRYYRCMKRYYKEGGDRYYAIGIPMEESIRVFQKARREEEAGKLLSFYRRQADFLLECGRNYPAHEVDYEQSIVAPAAVYFCELYRITGEEAYRKGANEQLEVLDLFQGFQPDYHMNEVAIRHWDGYWFGKRRCLGDTFPHYWSVLSGCAYRNSLKIPGSEQYAKRAEKTLRGVLSLIKEDGSASCAMVYPVSVNGKEAHFYDPWANDQDWGLYYYLKMHEGEVQPGQK